MKYKESKNIPLDQLVSLYNSVGWTSYTTDVSQLQQAISQSLTVITAWEEEKLVGLIRGVGDGVTILYIQDVLVLPSHQRLGVGTTLMTHVLSLYPDVRQKELLTEDTQKTRSFYEGFGFSSCDNGTLVSFYKEY